MGEFLRRKGLHREHLAAWTAAPEAALGGQPRGPTRSAEAKRIKELERELARRNKALAETTALLVLKKSRDALGGRGRRHRREERQVILGHLDEAIAGGASQAAACALLGLDERTVQRWRRHPERDDPRRGPKTRPGNALTSEEETRITALVTSKEFGELSPHQLVAKLADMGIYVASAETSIGCCAGGACCSTATGRDRGLGGAPASSSPPGRIRSGRGISRTSRQACGARSGTSTRSSTSGAASL